LTDIDSRHIHAVLQSVLMLRLILRHYEGTKCSAHPLKQPAFSVSSVPSRRNPYIKRNYQHISTARPFRRV